MSTPEVPQQGVRRETIERDVDTPMRDGAILRADVWRPAGNRPAPALIYRAPYDKRRITALDVLPAADAVAAGYAVVLQDTRGRFSSGGTWQPIMWDQEALDTYDTVEWTAAQPWCDGNVGMVGPSYLGIVQWVGAMRQPPHLRAIAPAMCTVGGYDDQASGGAIRLDHLVGWLVMMAADWLQRRFTAGKPPAQQTVAAIAEYAHSPRRAMEQLPLADILHLPDFPLPLRDVLSGKAEMKPACRLDAVRVPTLSVSGWYDVYSAATIGLYQDMTARSSSNHLVMGPWAHLGSLLPVQGELNFGLISGARYGGLAQRHLAFFDRYVRGIERDTPPVQYFLMGAGEWRTASSWPPPEVQPQQWYLRDGGTLSSQPPEREEPPARYRYDPADPVPSHGGRLLNLGDLVPGPLAQNHLEQRSDVLSYTSDVLPVALDLVGPARLRLYAESSAPDTDFAAKLIDVFPDGRAVLICDGILRARYREGVGSERPLRPGRVYELDIDLGHTAWRLAPGHRLQAHVTSSNFPQFDRNLNTDGPIGEESDPAVAEQTIHHGTERPSRLELTVLPAQTQPQTRTHA
ncbi:CocE/NonD family hydrolase [Streptomyces gobiensis]|uniref:CocE/NonD family hydrolase n=1 Tax=Streptomyces gobiensis TaxID=2875706 RepID=UPI001E3A226D|nr:CocE/NonD family hydrolase [Streptomyces gobiensis]UGY94131.1 CocE/NonD family hydrolase [Streptomyces gobiensis]